MNWDGGRGKKNEEEKEEEMKKKKNRLYSPGWVVASSS